MITLYITDVSDLELKSSLINRLTAERTEKLHRLKQISDKKLCLGAGLLLDDYVIKGKKSLYNISENGKPYFENGPYFSISHSGNFAVLAVSDNEIGCDIEKQTDRNFFELSRFVFHKNETELITQSDNVKDAFFTLWTKKEAFLKYSGIGFRRKTTEIDLSQDTFEENGIVYYFKHYNKDNCKICLCSAKNDFPENFVEVKY